MSYPAHLPLPGVIIAAEDPILLRIADCGLNKFAGSKNPQSEILNPQFKVLGVLAT